MIINPRAQALFVAALEFSDPAARLEMLDRECVGDGALRQRVEDLLNAHQAASGFGKDPSCQPLAATTEILPVVRPGTIVADRYKLLEQIGEGGMGVVWVAEQTEPVRRKVALKLVKAGMDSRTVIARFEAERQALALMDHPNIARVLDAGATSDGHPFFVMELVKGVPITDFCDARKLSASERLELFIPVCRAIQHAHQKGIIHRDIKPSNVLVALHDEHPVPKVIDFGVAKAIGQQLTEKTLYTGFGALIGTPMYMAPEQATFNQLDVDTRADIYSLGVLLYELLVGSPPFEAARMKQVALDEVLRLVREEEPQRPSARLSTSQARASIAAVRQSDPERLTRLMRGELDWIVMKALDKDRNRRYGTANGFATDVERYLSGEPVTAVPPSALYRLQKLFRRNRLLLSTTAGFIGILMLATAVSSWLAVRARRAEGKATASQKEAMLQADKAVTNLNSYHDALKEAEKQAAENLRLAETAESARRESSTMLADMQTERGLQSGTRTDVGSAAMWFANAALQTPYDPNRQVANRLRARNWLNEAMIPTALLKFPNSSMRRLSFQPGGPLLLALSSEKLTLWDWRYEQSLVWSEELANVADAAWSPDGARVALGFLWGQVRICEPATGTVLKSFDQKEFIQKLLWSPDGRRLVVAGKNAKVWKLDEEPVVEHDWLHPLRVHSLVFNRAGNRLATAAEDNLVRMFAVGDDAPLPEPLFAPIEHSPYRDSTARGAGPVFCDNDRQLVTILNTQRPGVWNVETGEPATFPVNAALPKLYQNLVASPASGWIAVSGAQSCLLWNSTGESHMLPHSNAVFSANFGPDGKSLLTTCFDGQARIWPVSSDIGSPLMFPQLETFAECVFSPDGECAAIAGQRQVIVWRLPRKDTQVGQIGKWTDYQWRGRPSFDGRLVTPGPWHETPWGHRARGNSLTVASMADGQPAGPKINLEGQLFDSCVCADNRSVAAICQSNSSGTLTVFDIATGSPNFPPISLPNPPISVATHPELPQVAVLCANGQLQVRNVHDGSLLHDLPHPGKSRGWPNARVVYSPDGATLVCVAPNDQVWIRDASTGEQQCPPLTPVVETGPCRTIAISPDSHWLATGVNGQNIVQVWDLATGAAAGPPLPHPGDLYGIFSIDFSPDSRVVLTGHKDGQVRLWDWRTGKLVGPPLKHPEEVYSARFTSDGRYVVTAVRNSTIQLWDVATAKPVAPPLGYPIATPEFSCGPLAMTGSRVIASAIGHPIFDLSKLLEPPTVDVASLLSQAELATNQRLIAGELLPLNQSEWDERWGQFVASRLTPAAAADELARSLDATSENTARLVIAKRALKADVLERLLALRPNVIQLHTVFADQLESKHEPLAAAEQRRLAIDAFQASLRDRTPDLVTAGAMAQLVIDGVQDVEWSSLEPTKTEAETDCSFTVESDGSILAAFVPNAKSDSYTIHCRSPIRRIEALQLEVLPHDKLPNRGPGWAIGNFVLTELQATLQRSDGTSVPLAFRSAASDVMRPMDHDTTPWDGPWGAIDGDDSTRWDIWPHPGESHWLKLQLTEPVDLGDADRLIVKLDFHNPYWGDNRLGHFRLRASTSKPNFVSQHFRVAVREHLIAGLSALGAAYLSKEDAKRAAEVLATDNENSLGTAGVRLLLLARSQELQGQTEAARATIDRLIVWLHTESLPEPLDQVCVLIASEINGLSREQLLGQLVEAAIHRRLTGLTRDVESAAETASKYSARGDFFTQLGRWSDSAADYLQAVKRDSQNTFLYENTAVALILAGDEAGYQEHCQSMLKLQWDMADPKIVDSLCTTCLLGPNAIDPAELPVDVLENAISDSVWEPYWPWFRVGRALLSYREGKHQESLIWTDVKGDESKSPKVAIACRLGIRAMAQQQLGQTETARQTLQAAKSIIPKDVRNLGVDLGSRPAPSAVVYSRWLIAECLRRQAASLIEN